MSIVNTEHSLPPPSSALSMCVMFGYAYHRSTKAGLFEADLSGCEGIRGSIEYASAVTRRVGDLKLNINNFEVKMEDKNVDKIISSYKHERTKVGIQVNQMVYTPITIKNYSVAQNIL